MANTGNPALERQDRDDFLSDEEQEELYEEKQRKENERLKKLREDRLFQLKCKFGSPLAEQKKKKRLVKGLMINVDYST